MKTFSHLWQYLSEFFFDVSDKSCRENRAIYEIMSINVVRSDGRTTDENVVHALSVLDKQYFLFGNYLTCW